MRIVYLTAKDKSEAKKISSLLLEKKLAACINMFPIESMYLWQGKITGGKEYAILVKTLDDNYSKVEKAIKRIHSYSVPAIYSWKVDSVNSDYIDWLRKEIER